MNILFSILSPPDLLRVGQHFRLTGSRQPFPTATKGESEPRRVPILLLAIFTLGLAWPGASQMVTASEGLAASFKDPPAQYRSRPLYWLNAPLDPAALREQIQAMRDQCGFGGFAPLTLHTAKPDYLTEGYFERYGLMLEMAEKLGLKVIFYDDINFPTGTAGGRLAKQFPASTLKNLRKSEKEFTGPGPIEMAVPGGTLMAAVAMESGTKQRLDLARFITDGKLLWEAPAGQWQVMFFACEPQTEFADYLKISDRLTGRVRRDFTFLHPEILDGRCRVEGTTLRLDNTHNWEEYRVVIIPGGEVISWSNLQKLQRFYDHGGFARLKVTSPDGRLLFQDNFDGGLPQ